MTTEYKELFAEFRSFVIKILFANLNRKQKVRFIPAQTSCESRCSEKRSNTFYCHCDDNCPLYGDCCYDYWRRYGLLYNILYYKITYFWIKYLWPRNGEKNGKLLCMFWHKLDRKTLYAYRCFLLFNCFNWLTSSRTNRPFFLRI